MPDHKTILLKTSPENCALFTKNTQPKKRNFIDNQRFTGFSSHHYAYYEFGGGDETELFSILNTRIAKKIRNANHEGLLALTFQNLFDDYFNFEREQVFKTRVFLTLEYGLN